MGDEYGLKKDRDRPYFAGQFIWSGLWTTSASRTPTPSSRSRDRSSGRDRHRRLLQGRLLRVQVAVDHDADDPHLGADELETDYTPGQTVQVWVDANQASAQLWLNGVNLGPPLHPFVLKTSEVTGTASLPGQHEHQHDSLPERLHLHRPARSADDRRCAVLRDERVQQRRQPVHGRADGRHQLPGQLPEPEQRTVHRSSPTRPAARASCT